MILHRQVEVHAVRLHVVIAIQGEQASTQKARSSAQFRLQEGLQTGQFVVTPSQVTDPLVPGQLLSVAEQLVVLLLPWQLTLPLWQVAEAVQSAFAPTAGGFAASVGATGTAREERKA